MTPDKTSENRRPDGVTAPPKGSSPDEFTVFMPARAPRAGLATRHMLLTGVASACVLGVGLGIWARPAMSERKVSAAAPVDVASAAPLPSRKLEIVVDDRPAPVGAPIEVLSDRAPPPMIAPTPPLATRAVASPARRGSATVDRFRQHRAGGQR